MKTVFINGSPKKRWSASSYLISLQTLFVKGEKVTVSVRHQQNFIEALEAMKDADNVVLCTPLYVDGLPSHVLYFLREVAEACRQEQLKLNVYVIANNGFIEGRQNEPLFLVVRNFCERAHLRWCGGVGIGGGVMLNVTRIVFVVQFALFLLQFLFSGVLFGGPFPSELVSSFLLNAGVLLFLNLGVLLNLFRQGHAMNRGEENGHRFTRILLPSFVFILIADIFFTVVSFFQGGLFRGWLASKKPDLDQTVI